MKFCDLKTQQLLIKERIDAAIQRVLDHEQYILGPEVYKLEEKLTLYTGAKHCITVANGTDALVIALMSAGVGRGHEVITPGFTYVAVAEAISFLGAKPVYVDIETNTFNINPEEIERNINSKTKAIIPVSLFGQCADFDEINGIAARHSVVVIEDAAQSFGAVYKDRKSCNLSDISCTSFFPSKPLGCYGDGGAIFTNSDEIAELARKISRHGQEGRYNHVIRGCNSRLDTLQAAILLEKLTLFDKEIEMRNTAASKYSTLLERIPGIEIPIVKTHNISVYAQYTVKLDKRDKVRKFLESREIPTSVHYPLPLYLQRAFMDKTQKHPGSEYAAAHVLCLPMHPYLNDEDIVKVVNHLSEAVQ